MLLGLHLPPSWCSLEPPWGQNERHCSHSTFLRGFEGLSCALVGPSWGFLGASWGPLGASWRPLVALLRPLWAPWRPLGLSCAFLGPSWCFLSAPCAPLGASWRSPGALLRLLGASWHPLGAFLCPLGAVLGLPESFSSKRVYEFHPRISYKSCSPFSNLFRKLTSCHTSLIQVFQRIQASKPPGTYTGAGGRGEALR